MSSIQSPSDGPKYYGSEFSVGSTSSSSGDPNTSGISVIARLKETLPDTYTFFDDWSQNEFRLLKMETVTLLNGIEMTDEFYYIDPDRLYDRFFGVPLIRPERHRPVRI